MGFYNDVWFFFHYECIYLLLISCCSHSVFASYMTKLFFCCSSPFILLKYLVLPKTPTKKKKTTTATHDVFVYQIVVAGCSIVLFPLNGWVNKINSCSYKQPKKKMPLFCYSCFVLISFFCCFLFCFGAQNNKGF